MAAMCDMCCADGTITKRSACGAGRFRSLQRHERITASWFAMTGVVHFIIEGARAGVPADAATNIRMLYPTIMFTLVAGYVVLHPGFYKDTSGGVLPEICEQQR